MAASLTLQSAPMTAYAADDDQQEPGVEQTLEQEETLEQTSQEPAESSAGGGEDNQVPPSNNDPIEIKENEPAPAADPVPVTEPAPVTDPVENAPETVTEVEESETVTSPALMDQVVTGDILELQIGEHGELKNSSGTGGIIETGGTYEYTIMMQDPTNAAIESDIASKVKGVHWGYQFSGLQINKGGSGQFADLTDETIIELGDILLATFAEKQYAVEASIADNVSKLAIANYKDDTHATAAPQTATLNVELIAIGNDPLPADTTGMKFVISGADDTDPVNAAAAELAPATGTPLSASTTLTANAGGNAPINVEATIGSGADAITFPMSGALTLTVVENGYVTFNLDPGTGGDWASDVTDAEKTLALDTDENGEVSGTALLTALNGKEAKLVAPTGQEFDKWQYEAIVDVDDNASFGDEGTVELTAAYKDIDYSVTYGWFDEDGDAIDASVVENGLGNPETYTTKEMSSAHALNDPDITKDGYTAANGAWYKTTLDANGKPVFTNDPTKKVTEIPANSAEDLVLIYVFNLIEYSIDYRFYVGNDAVGTDECYLIPPNGNNPNTKTTFTVKDAEYVLRAPSLDGHTFRGWYRTATEEDPAGSDIWNLTEPINGNATIPQGTHEDVTFHGRFSENAEIYDIYFDVPNLVMQKSSTVDSTETVQVHVNASGILGTNYDLTFASTNPDAVTVSAVNGDMVTLKAGTKKGSATIRATAKGSNEKIAVLRVTVQDEAVVKPETIELTETLNGEPKPVRQTIIDNGANQQMVLSAKVKGAGGADATVQDVVWEIANAQIGGTAVSSEQVASVNALTGLVTVRPQTKNASFTIRVTSQAKNASGHHVNATVTVNIDKYYTVTFTDEMNPDGSFVISVKCDEALSTGVYVGGDHDGEAVNTIAPPAAVNGYENPKWTYNGVEVDGTTGITENIAVVASRDAIEYTVTFHFENASSYADYADEAKKTNDYDKIGNPNANVSGSNSQMAYTVTYKNGEVFELEDATLDNYTFIGWYSDSSRSDESKVTEFDPNSFDNNGNNLNGDVLDLYAKFTRDVTLELKEKDSSNDYTGNVKASSYVANLSDTGTPATFDLVKGILTPDGSGHAVTYSISPAPVEGKESEAIALINEGTGVVTLQNEGEVTVTASADGKSASYVLQIVAANVQIREPAYFQFSGLEYDGEVYKFHQTDHKDNTLPASITLGATVYAVDPRLGLVPPTDGHVEWDAEAATVAGGAPVEGVVSVSDGRVTFDTSKITTNLQVTVTATARADHDKNAKIQFTIDKYYEVFTVEGEGKTPQSAGWVKVGETIPAEMKPKDDPKAKGKTFRNWKKGNADGTIAIGTAEFDFGTAKMDEENLYLVADWEATKVHVTYVYDQNTDPLQKIFADATGDATYGEAITIPTTEQHQDRAILMTTGSDKYRFEGWFTNTACTTPFDASKESDKEEDFSVYAKMVRVYDVKFDAGQFQGSAITFVAAPVDLVVADGEGFTLPDGMMAQGGGRIFKEWKKGTGAEAVSFTQTNANRYMFSDAEKSAKGITLTAHWETEDDRTVTFVMDTTDETGVPLATTSSVPDARTVVYGTATAEPTNIIAADPANYPYIEGWYTQDGKKWDFKDLVTTDLTLTAKWNVKTYTVTFKTNIGNEDLKTSTAAYKTLINAADIPVRATDGIKTWGIAGWADTPNAMEVQHTSAQVAGAEVTGDKIYYAVYQMAPTKDEAYEAFDNLFKPIVVVTNNYGTTTADTVVSKVNLADYEANPGDSTGWNWYQDATTTKTVASYAGRGVVALPLQYTVGDESVVITVPVRFVTVTKLTLYYDGAALEKDDVLFGDGYLEWIPTVTGGNINDDAAVKEAIDGTMMFAGTYGQVSGESRNALIKAEVDGNNIFQDFVVQDTSAMNKATAVPLILTWTPVNGRKLVASTKVTVVPEPAKLSDFDITNLDPDNVYTYEPNVDAAFQGPVGTSGVTLSGKITGNYAVKVTSDNAKVVRVGKVTYATDTFSVPLTLTGGYGTAILTIEATDAAKTKAQVCVTIYPAEAQVSTTTAILDMVQMYDTLFTVTPPYSDQGMEAQIMSVEAYRASGAAPASVLKDIFKLEREGGSYTYRLSLTGDSMDDIEGLVAGTYKLKLSDGVKQIGKDIVVTVRSTQPKVTITQLDGAINLNYNPGMGEGVKTLRILANGYAVNHVRFTGDSAEYLNPPYVMSNARPDPNGGPYTLIDVMPNDLVNVDRNSAKKVSVAMDAAGLRKGAVIRDFTLNVTDKMPVMKLSQAAVTLYPELGITKQNMYVTINGKVADYSARYELTGSAATLYEATPAAQNTVNISLKNPAATATRQTGKLRYRDLNLKADKYLEASLTVAIGKKASVVARLSKPVVTLNSSAYAENDMVYDYISLTGVPLIYGAWPIDRISFDVTPVNAGAGIKIEQLNPNSATAVVSWDGTNNRPAKGNYTYDLTVKLNVNGNDYPLNKPVRLTVKVVDTAQDKVVSFSQKGAIDLMNKDSAITVTPKFVGINGTTDHYSRVVLGGKDAPLFKVSYIDPYTGAFTVVPAKDASMYVTGHKYDVTIDSVTVQHDDYRFRTELKGIAKKLTVVLRATAPKVTSIYPGPGTMTIEGTANRRGNALPLLVNATHDIAKITQIIEKPADAAFSIGSSGVTINPFGYAGGDNMATVRLEQQYMIKKGTYTVKFLVTFKDQPANAKDTIVSYRIVVK